MDSQTDNKIVFFTGENCEKNMPLDDIIEEYDDEILKMDGYDDCIEGVVHRFPWTTFICYNERKVIDKLTMDGMTEEEAYEFFEYNMVGAWMGERTPCFLRKK